MKATQAGWFPGSRHTAVRSAGVGQRHDVMRPLVFWLAGIAALIAVLVVGGAFQRPVVFAIAAVAVVAFFASFLLFSRARRK